VSFCCVRHFLLQTVREHLPRQARDNKYVAARESSTHKNATIDLCRDFAFELRVTDVTAAGKPSHTWPLLTLGPERFLQFPGEISSDRSVLSPVRATELPPLFFSFLFIPGTFPSWLLCVLSLSWHGGVQATALPWIPEAVAAANASTRPGPKGAQVVSRQLSEHGLRVEVWPWRYLPEDGRTGTLCKTSQGTGPENRTNKWLPCSPQFCLSILSFSQHAYCALAHCYPRGGGSARLDEKSHRHLCLLHPRSRGEGPAAGV
jgi:hypothetical protein